jgi:hypothetical protein
MLHIYIYPKIHQYARRADHLLIYTREAKHYESSPMSSKQHETAISQPIQTVKFENDLEPNVSSLPAPHVDNSRLQSSHQEGRDHTIKDTLGRPFIVRTGDWSIVAPANATLASFDMFSLLSSTNVNDKIKGFLINKADINIKLVVNAQRMQQGRLCVSYYPDTNDTPRKTQLDLTRMSRTQRPRVDLDASMDTDVTLTIPYISRYLGYNLSDFSGQQGSFDIWVYSPLVAVAGPTTVSYTVFMWMTNVELQYPTFVAQCLSEPTFHAQVAGATSTRKRGDPEAKESETGSGLNVSKSAPVNTLKQFVSTLSSLSGVPEWAKVIAQGGAMALGWSKPIGDFSAGRMESGVFAHSNHADGTTFARNMGIISKNHVQVLPGFAGQDVDEMSLNYICSIPAYFREAEWRTNTTVGSNLMNIELTPTTFSEPYAPWEFRTPINYMSTFFKYWRGSLMFHFKLVKTEFHSGRILLIWTPGTNAPTVTLDQSQYCYRQVLDIRESNEFSVTIPYVSNKAYIASSNGVFPKVGRLQLMVLNELTTPDTAPNYVTVLAEVCACDDLEFAMPTRPLSFPVAPGSATTAGFARVAEEKEDIPLGELVLDEERTFHAQMREPQMSMDQTWQFIFERCNLESEFREMTIEFERAKANDKYLGAVATAVSAFMPWPYDDEGWPDFDVHSTESMKEQTPAKGRIPLMQYVLWIYKITGKPLFQVHSSLFSEGRTLDAQSDLAKAIEATIAYSDQNVLMCAHTLRRKPKHKKRIPRGGYSTSTSAQETTPEPELFTAAEVDDATETPPQERSFHAQVLGEAECEDDKTATIAMAAETICSTTVSSDVSHAAHCIGERVTSIKQLLLRLTPWRALPTQGTGVTFRFRDKFFSGVEATGNAVNSMQTGMDYLNLFAPMFGYYRGSFRYSVYNQSNTSMNVVYRISLMDTDTQFGNNLFQTVATGDANLLYNQTYNVALAHGITAGGIEFQTPFYSNLPTQQVRIYTTALGPNAFNEADNMVSIRQSSSATGVILRGAGDDFSFGLFVGVPPTIATFGLTGSPVTAGANYLW